MQTQGDNRDMVWLAAVAMMLSDHLGAWVLSDPTSAFLARLVGRGGLLLWGWFTAQGLLSSRDRSAYTVRLWVVAAIAEIPYLVLTARYWNPVHSLALAATVCLFCLEYRLLYALALAALGVCGLVVLDGSWLMFAAPIVFVAAYSVRYYRGAWVSELLAGVTVIALDVSLTGAWCDGLGLLGLWAIWCAPPLRIATPRWVKYSIYPAHLAVLALLRVW